MPKAPYAQIGEWHVEEALLKYAGMRLVPHAGAGLYCAGRLLFAAKPSDKELIEDEYQVKILIPDKFPKSEFSVWESGERIPIGRHRNEDGTLCLGSPRMIHLALSRSRTLLTFIESCLIPYLYGYSYLEKHGIWPFGELLHGTEGLYQDWASEFGVDDPEAIRKFVCLASLRKRVANKFPCPCGGAKRLGKCHNVKLNYLRDVLGRPWFRDQKRLLSK